MMDRVAAQSPWVFGLEPSEIRSFLETFHLAVVEDFGHADYQEKYLKPLGRKLVVFEGERIVHASVA
jgi:O-methyltransferase involved in polyketide biosynthesis